MPGSGKCEITINSCKEGKFLAKGKINFIGNLGICDSCLCFVVKNPY